MRVRHAPIAVSSSSGARSTGALTGFGELMITSCAPTAGRDTNSSGIPRPDRIGSSTASGWPLASAGYRFGTTRTFQPGVSGPAPLDLSAQTSGGVRSSLPSANGSFCGSIGGRSSTFEANAPGRAARSPAMIARRPLSGSMRSSGKALLHRHVRDAFVHELLALHLEAAPLIERARRRLRVQADPLCTGRTAVPLGGVQNRGTDSTPACIAFDRHPAQLRQAVVEDQPAGPEDPAVLDRDQMRRLRIQPVAVRSERDPLLVHEDAPPQFERLGDLRRAGCEPNLDHGE